MKICSLEELTPEGVDGATAHKDGQQEGNRHQFPPEDLVSLGVDVMSHVHKGLLSLEELTPEGVDGAAAHEDGQQEGGADAQQVDGHHGGDHQGIRRVEDLEVDVEPDEQVEHQEDREEHLGTFREHSGNIQGTFRERSGNIQGTFREHSGNVQGTFREQLEPKTLRPAPNK
jgi:hypothetical protein